MVVRFQKIALAMILCCPLIAVQTFTKMAGPITATEIGNKLISSYGVITEETSSHEQEAVEAINLDLPELTLQEKRKIVWDIFREYEENNVQTVSDNYQQSLNNAMRMVVDDIELFYAHDDKDHSSHLFSKINYTDTVMGEAMLARMLAKPITDIATLQRRQELIKELVHNEQLFLELELLINELKKAEPALYSYWVNKNKETQHLIDSLYPVPNSRLFGRMNKSAVTLEAYTRLGNIGTVWNMAGDLILNAGKIYITKKMVSKLGPYVGLNVIIPSAKLDSNGSDENQSFMQEMKASFSLLSYIYNPLLFLKLYLRLRNPEPQTMFNVPIFPKVGENSDMDQVRAFLTGACLTSTALTSAMLALKLFSMKKVLDMAVLNNNIANSLHERLIGVATFMRALKKVHKLGKKNQSLRHGLSFYSSIDAILDGTQVQSDALKELIFLLQTDTFKGQSSFFSYTGRVLAANNYMETEKRHFALLLEMLGQLDAYLSMAKLYKQYAQERVGYNFVEFKEVNSPYLAMHEFWNPQIDPAKVVSNSIELGMQDGKRAIILTGSNTGGKSTLLKAILCSIVMAQTFGIAPVKKMLLTPLDYFVSSMNIQDDIAGGKSLHQQEVDRAVAIIGTAQDTHERGGKSFLGIDELFRGTGPVVADKETYDCAKRLANMDLVLFIMATHYTNKPTSLEHEMVGVVKNYKIDAYLDAQGAIVRPFILEPGISTTTIAETMLQDGFDNRNR